MTTLSKATSLATAALALAASAGAGAAQDGPSGEITLMAYAGIFQDLYTENVVEPFEEKFPNVTVNYYTTGSSANMLGALRPAVRSAD